MELWWEFFEEENMSKGELTRLSSRSAGSLGGTALGHFPVSDPLEVTCYPHCGQSSRHSSPNQAHLQPHPHCSCAHTAAAPPPQLHPHCSWSCTSSLTRLPSPVCRAGVQHKRPLGVALKELTTRPRQRPCSPVAFLSGFCSHLGFSAIRDLVRELNPWRHVLGGGVPWVIFTLFPVYQEMNRLFPPTLLPPLCATFCLSLWGKQR